MATVSDHPSTLHRHSHSSEKPKNKFTAKSHSQLQPRLKTHSNFTNTRTNSWTAKNQTKIKQKSPNRLHRRGVVPFQGCRHSPKQLTNEGERPDPIDEPTVATAKPSATRPQGKGTQWEREREDSKKLT